MGVKTVSAPAPGRSRDAGARVTGLAQKQKAYFFFFFFLTHLPFLSF
jgi:hypothetical protein